MHRLPHLSGEDLPSCLEEAYHCQDQLIPHLLEHFGGSVVGYKIACTNEVAQRQLSVSHPFFGRMLSATSYDSPVCLDPSPYFMRVMEAEFAFRMARDLPPIGRPYTVEEASEAVEGVMAGIEIVDSRYDSWTTVGTPSLIADNACHGAWVHGPLVTDWRHLDLAAQPVELWINGTLKDTGSGRAVLGHPLNALLWLANALNARGLQLKVGDNVTTGVTTDIYLAGPGDHIEADFGPVGRVVVDFS
ncbi:MAG: fumarylacetoacetate hydrolase family protein [Acidobacteriota bacterium]